MLILVYLMHMCVIFLESVKPEGIPTHRVPQLQRDFLLHHSPDFLCTKRLTKINTNYMTLVYALSIFPAVACFYIN